MTLETREPPPAVLSLRIQWHFERAWTFYDAARKAANAADARRAHWHAAIGVRADTHSLTDADRNCDNDSLFKGYVDAQQMYDRWSMREFSAITALTCAAGYHRELTSETKQASAAYTSAQRENDD